MTDARTCNETRSLMADWLDGELSAALSTRVDEHLADCDSCRAAYGQMSAMNRDLALLGLTADRIAERASRGVRPSPVWRRAWVRAAAVMILVAGGIHLASVRRWTHIDRNVVDREPSESSESMGDAGAIALLTEGQCRAEGHTAVALASSNPRVRIVWLYEDAGVGDGSTESGGGARPRPRG